MRVVLDTNVLLAGLGTHGLCESLVLSCLRSQQVFSSHYILDEFARHYRSKFKSNAQFAEAMVAMLEQQTIIVEPVHVVEPRLTDVDDLPVLGTAVAAEAHALVTGDRQLLALGHANDVPIITPRLMYDRLKSDAR